MMRKGADDMFQMTVDDVATIQGKTLISGKCVNKNEVTNILVDETGTEYIVKIPFIKHLLSPEWDYITLESMSIANPDILRGRILRNAS